ncbi:MAG: YfbK domain-containing protein, partial [Bacteroidota bacterium]
GLQGRRIDQAQLPTQNLVFLLDVSGSMNASNKLPLVQRSLRLLVNQMRPQDRIAIVVYAGAAGLVLPSTPGHQKDSIMAALAALEAGGSTAGGEGIRLAYQQAREHFMDGGNNRIILCTDGDFNVGVSSEEGLTALIEEKRATGIFLTVLGFGTGNYQDARMELLADKGNGNYAYIDNILEAKKVLISEMGGTLQTIAKDVKLQVEFNPAHVSAYRLIGYENRLLAAEDFNDDAKDAGELGAGHTVTALYEIVPAVAASPVSIDTLRYQGRSLHATKGLDAELLTIKFRYKAPQGSESQLITHPLNDQHTDLNRTSDNFRFSAAVAAFGMLLRDSEHKASANTDQVLQLARNAKGKDRHGYRAEFIRMVETYQLLASE